MKIQVLFELFPFGISPDFLLGDSVVYIIIPNNFASASNLADVRFMCGGHKAHSTFMITQSIMSQRKRKITVIKKRLREICRPRGERKNLPFGECLLLFPPVPTGALSDEALPVPVGASG